MGRVKITEKPGVWPYVLVNDFKSPPYFAYEHVDENGNRNFIKVRNGGPDEGPEPSPILNLTLKRKAKITRFLKEVLKTPLKYGQFMSKEWIQQLVKFLDLFDENSIEANSYIVKEWLKNSVFEKLMKEIGESIAATKVSGESPSSSSSHEGETSEEEDSSDDDDLFIPFVVRVKRTQDNIKMD